jgi:copper transport protein
VWGAGGLAWLAVAGLILARPPIAWVRRPATVDSGELALPATPAVLTALGLLVALLALLPAVGGHAAFQAPVALLLPANLLHVVAIGTWLGGLAVLLVAVPAATARLAPANRTRLLAAVLARFSTLAAAAVTVVLASGVTQAIVSLNTPAHLLDTAYGRAVLAKASLFTALVALGQVNRRRRLPAMRRAALENQEPGRTGLLLRRTLRAEITLGIAVFAATGALAGFAPASAIRPPPTGAATTRLGRLNAIEQNRVLSEEHQSRVGEETGAAVAAKKMNRGAVVRLSHASGSSSRTTASG